MDGRLAAAITPTGILFLRAKQFQRDEKNNSMVSRRIVFFLMGGLLCVSCGKKKLKSELTLKTAQIEQLEGQIEHLQSSNTALLDRLNDLSVISMTGAESIQQSLESINDQYEHINELNEQIRLKDSLNLALVLNLKRSLQEIDDEDIQVEVRDGVVHVSISDRLLFRSGSARLGNQARTVLGKIATVVNDHDELNILVEGHTDDVPINNDCMVDNWDLSVKRATTVVRSLQQDYLVDPQRLTAGGRAEYVPKSDNSTELGRGLNRRTEIVIAPKLDQFFELLQRPDLKG